MASTVNHDHKQDHEEYMFDKRASLLVALKLYGATTVNHDHKITKNIFLFEK
jgi:hypothetical protein